MDKDYGYCTFMNQNRTITDKNNQMSLRDAIRSRNTDLVRRLIACGAEANGYTSNISYHRPLHLAVISRSTEIVQILLDGGADVNILSQDGETSLTLAAKLENNSIVDLLLTHNVKNIEDAFYNLSHLHVSCMRNKFNVAKKLLMLNQGSDINKAVKENSMCWPGYTALHFAVHYGCYETVDVLLKCGADITAKEARQMTPLQLAHLHRNEDIIDLILRQHIYEHRNPEHDAQPSHFHIACSRDNPSIVEHFLRSGVDVNLRTKSPHSYDWRPIDFALYYECPKVTQLLLKSNVKLFGFEFSKLLKCAFMMGNTVMHELITKRNISSSPVRQTCRDLTKLHHACIQDDTVKIEELFSDDEISAPSDFNLPIWTGRTALHLAVQCNSASVTEFLLDHGANCMVQDSEGNTPLHISFKSRFHGVFSKILEHFNSGFQNLTDESGLSVLHILCTTTKVETIESLISQGTDINAQVSNESVCWAGFTPLHFATKFRQQKAIILLLKSGANISIKNSMHLSPTGLLVDHLQQYFYDAEIESTISEILQTIFSSLERSTLHCDLEPMSLLHALCLKKTDPTVFQDHLRLYTDKIDVLTHLPNSPKLHGCTALHFAMQRQYFAQAKILVQHGADPLLINFNGETPLESGASEFGLFEWNDDDLDSLFPLHVPIENYKTSHFHLACCLGLSNTVGHVLNKASDKNSKMRFINSLNDAGQTPLLSLLVENEISNERAKKEFTLFLLENGADVNAKDFEFKTPLHWTEHPEDFDVVRTLVSYGADINAQNVYGQTPLYVLFRGSLLSRDNSKIIEYILENGGDINILDENGKTCMVQTHQMYQSRRENDNMIKNSVVTFLKHAKKLDVLGLHVNQVNKEAYAEYLRRFHEVFNEATFVDHCNKELESLANVKIDSWTTLKDILCKRPDQMALYCDNLVLQTVATSNEISEKFPNYGFLVKLQLKYGNECKKALLVLSRTGLPYVCLEIICKYLSKSDLRNVVLSTKISDK
ncbi:hypothetical protein QAD02_018250 [Eretmocerus hayati]|uniref:Uncharacterized protein n=1 Tax=Eretmocerus hayati TaxID=131215 RepID=A0ACC2PHA2_9HYME|nr:hypothetical protein QAD02_018250 [Eretmocerus hayati]